MIFLITNYVSWISWRWFNRNWKIHVSCIEWLHPVHVEWKRSTKLHLNQTFMIFRTASWYFYELNKSMTYEIIASLRSLGMIICHWGIFGGKTFALSEATYSLERERKNRLICNSAFLQCVYEKTRYLSIKTRKIMFLVS